MRTCEFCERILYKHNRGGNQVKRFFVLHEEVIDYFNRYVFIPTIEEFSFNLSHVIFLGSMECGDTRGFYY